MSAIPKHRASRLRKVAMNELPYILSSLEQEQKGEAGNRIGLALSGGGFRASFFHIGVLAELARLGLLQKIDVISTVSGGSIVGAYYYLTLKRYLKDKKISGKPVDYKEVVNDVAERFYKRTRKSIRNRYFLRSFLPGKTEHKLSRLLDKIFYDEFAEEAGQPVRLEDLFANAEGLPKIMINTTNLNLGRLCCFSSDQDDAEENFLEIANQLTQHSPEGFRLDYKKFTLGTVVAASSCVPGLFNPVTFDLDYSTLSFVDGGVSDNTGILSLANDSCNLFLISDASLYMDYQAQPSTDSFGTTLRTTDIFMDQVKKHTLGNLMNHSKILVHINIREELAEKTPGYIDGVIPTTAYGVNYYALHYLSRMRTDLNKFTEVEAKALMNVGASICKHAIEKQPAAQAAGTIDGLFAESQIEGMNYTYEFENNHIRQELVEPSTEFLKILNISNRRIFKTLNWIDNPRKLHRAPVAKINLGTLMAAIVVTSIICMLIVQSMINDGSITVSIEEFGHGLIEFVIRLFLYGVSSLLFIILLLVFFVFFRSNFQYYASSKKILKTRTKKINRSHEKEVYSKVVN